MSKPEEKPESGVLVGVDGSEASMIAIDWAAQHAATTGLPLTLCHVCPGAEQMPMPIIAPLTEEIADRGRDILTRAAERARKQQPQLTVHTYQSHGQEAEVLRDAADASSVLVVGRHGAGRFHHVVAGSVSSQLAAHARCTVVVTKERPAASDGHVVVGVDDTPQMAGALDFAFTLASATGAEVLALRAVMIPDPFGPKVTPLDTYVLDARDAAQQLIDDLIAPWTQKYPDVPVRTEVSGEPPATALVDASEDAGLVVVGSRGRGGFAGLLLGSTSQRVVTLADCPVAVTH